MRTHTHLLSAVAALVGNGDGVLADIYPPEKRGTAYGFFLVFLYLGYGADGVHSAEAAAAVACCRACVAMLPPVTDMVLLAQRSMPPPDRHLLCYFDSLPTGLYWARCWVAFLQAHLAGAALLQHWPLLALRWPW